MSNGQEFLLSSTSADSLITGSGFRRIFFQWVVLTVTSAQSDHVLMTAILALPSAQNDQESIAPVVLRALSDQVTIAAILAVPSAQIDPGLVARAPYPTPAAAAGSVVARATTCFH
mmetsp:Transcript_117419/g.228301  ORF Transcript_117419/g.228301 Transcript_117419/m.228301 type:complete len:116 (+) Transcript_117419:258-605(+)